MKRARTSALFHSRLSIASRTATVAAAVSFVAAILMAISWGFSFSTSTNLTIYPLTVWDFHGRLSFGFLRFTPPPKWRFDAVQVDLQEDDMFGIVNEPNWRVLGIHGGHLFVPGNVTAPNHTFEDWFIDIPYWLLLPAALVLPSAWTRALAQAAEQSAGRLLHPLRLRSSRVVRTMSGMRQPRNLCDQFAQFNRVPASSVTSTSAAISTGTR